MAVLAGCVSDKPVEHVAALVLHEQYTDAKLVDLRFTASDGTLVHGTAYLPTAPRAGAHQADRFGTVVNLSPYYTNLYGIDTDGRLASVRAGARHLNQTGTGLLLAHGFAYVAASVPGTGGSGGCFEMGGLHEQTVMSEFIDWVGSQPWSNGKVGMAGGSYDGTTQWMVAIHHPQHLATIVPAVSITDFYDYMYQDGAPYAWWGPYFEPYYAAEVGMNIDTLDVPPSASPQMDTAAGDLCPTLLDHVTETETTYATGVYDSFWQARDYAAGMANITASVLMTHGLWDWNVKPIHLDVWARIPTAHRMWLQQMQHNSPYLDTFKASYKRDDWNATLLAWYDHYLNGADNGVPNTIPNVTVQDHTGLWRIESQWPPERETDTALHLGAGTISPETPPAGSTVFLTAPSYVAASAEPSEGIAGPQAPDQFVAKFLSAPLAAPLRIAGVPQVQLNLSVDRPGYAHIVAELWVLHANGSWEFLDMGGRGLAQRDGRTQDESVTPLETMAVPVAMNPTESYLAAGDRVALLLAGDDGNWFHPNGNLPTYTVLHTSTIHLPTLPGDAPRGISSDQLEALNPYYQVANKVY